MTSSRSPKVGRSESRHALVASHWFQTGMTIDAEGLSIGGFSPWTGVMAPLSAGAGANRGSRVSRLLDFRVGPPKKARMITFGICIGSEDKFEKYALPGLRRCAEPDSAIAEGPGNAAIFKGYDLDICFQARAAGKRVVVEEFDLFHHTKTGYGDEASFARADATFREKWFGDRGTGRSRDCAICGTAVPEPRHCIEDRKIVPC